MKEYKMDSETRELDETCVCVNSDLCYWLSGRVSCEDCYIASLKNDEQKLEAQERWEGTLQLLPTNVDELHETEECQFCKQKKHKSTGYGVFEMAHQDPYFSKGMFFGFGKKVRTEVGSLVSIQAAICPDCKRAFRMMDIFQVAGLLLGIVIGFILLLIPAIAQPMYNLFPLLPVGFLALISVAGYHLGKYASQVYLKKIAKSVKIDLSEIPIIAAMLGRGWFFFQTNDGLPRLSFKERKQFRRLLRKEYLQKEEQTKQDEEESDIPLDNMNI